MKKLLTISAALAAFASQASAFSPLDPTYRVKANQWNTNINFQYAQPSGDIIGTDGVFAGPSASNITYGIMDQLNVFVEGASVRRPAVGANFQLSGARAFGLDLIGKYEMTVDDNIVTGGVNMYGFLSRDLQWGVKVFGRYAGLDTFDNRNIVSILPEAAVLYQFDTRWAVKAGGNYNIDMTNSDALSDTMYMYSGSLFVGAVYALSNTAAVMPYAARSFETTRSMGGTSVVIAESSVTLGAQFGVQF
jgi:hypothetical protein